jgi:hypothetical protein
MQLGRAAKWTIRKWTNVKDQEYCKHIPRQKHAKVSLQETSAKISTELLQTNRN